MKIIMKHYLFYKFREGYLRLSSFKFNLDNINDKFVHLTNNAV